MARMRSPPPATLSMHPTPTRTTPMQAERMMQARGSALVEARVAVVAAAAVVVVVVVVVVVAGPAGEEGVRSRQLL